MQYGMTLFGIVDLYSTATVTTNTDTHVVFVSGASTLTSMSMG